MEIVEAAQAGVVVEVVVVIPAPVAGGIHFGLWAVEGQMLRGCERRGGMGGGLLVVCGQGREEFCVRGETGCAQGSGYLRVDA